MKINTFFCGFTAFIIFALLSFVPCFAVVPDDNSCPPNPPSSGYSSSNVDCVGTTAYYSTNNVYYCGYIACNYPIDYYGSFITTSYGEPQMRIYAYIRVGVGGVFDRTDITWQTIGRDIITGGLSPLTPWGNFDWSFQYKTIESYNNSIQYLKVSNTVSLPHNVDYDSYSYFNDVVQFLEKDFSEYTEQDIFNLCLDFSHPSVIGVYDDTVPSFTKANFNFSNIIDDNVDKVAANRGVISGELQSLLSDGTQYTSSEYFVDLRTSIKYNLSVMGGNEYSPILTLAQSQTFSHSYYGQNDLDLTTFNDMYHDDMLLFVRGVPSAPPGRVRIVTADSITLNVRLRRRSDGNYGNWLVVKADNVGDSVWNGREQPVSSGVSGIQYGSEPLEGSVSTIDSGLTGQTGVKVNFTVDGSALGSSSNGSRIYEGGGNHSTVDVGAITQSVKSVPQLFGVVFSFLPPEILLFISVAFVTLIAVAIVKAIT